MSGYYIWLSLYITIFIAYPGKIFINSYISKKIIFNPLHTFESNLSKLESLNHHKIINVKQQITGVWHFYFPKSLYNTTLFSNNKPNFERIWTYDNGLSLLPGTACNGLWNCSSKLDLNGLADFNMALEENFHSNSKAILKGFVSFSEKPIFVQWGGKVVYHSVQIIGATYIVWTNDHVKKQSSKDQTHKYSLKLPDGYQLIDENGTLNNFASEQSNTKQNQDTEDTSLSSKETWSYLGNFIAHRVLGEDRSDKRPHFFSDKGPMKLYNFNTINDDDNLISLFLNAPSINLKTNLDNSSLKLKMEQLIKCGPH